MKYTAAFIVFGLLFIGLQVNLLAQLPDCNNFYFHSGTTIYQRNTTTNTTTTNTIAMPSGSAGLAVSNNINGGTPAITFYTTKGGNYYYYNGSTWVNTGHGTGSSAAVNIGGAGSYIFNLVGGAQQVYRYDGTGTGVLVLTITGWGGPYDCIGDAAGNFYILKTNSAPYTLTMYNPNGVQLCVYNLVGFPTSSAGGGYAIVNNVLYATIGSTSCYGNISGTTITYAGSVTLGGGASDYANCEFPPLLVNILVPGSLTCSSLTTTINASTSLTSPTWSWAGPGIISGGNTSTPTINAPGVYTVTVTSSNGCTNSASTTCTVIQTGGMSISNINTNVLCNGDNTGAIDLTPTSGVSPFTYLWNTGAVTEDVNNIIAGTYIVNVTDNSGCSITSSYTITEPTTSLSLNTSTTPALCDATNGSATVVASGGTGAYTYNWATSVFTTSTITNLTGGIYTVTVTDANLCTQTSTTTVLSTAAPTISNSLLTDVTCLGGSNGAISIVASNGVSPYSYSWSSGGNLPTEANLLAGTYNVLVTENTGCTATASYTINPGANLPEIDLIGDDLLGCTEHCVNFNIPPSISTVNLQSYQWLVGSSIAGNASTLNHCFNSAGNYDITLAVIDNIGCTNSVTKLSYISVEDAPIANFTTDKTSYTESEAQVHITDDSYNVINHQWEMGDGITYTNLINFSHSYIDTGVFCIKLTVNSALGCIDTKSNCILIQGESNFYIPNSFTPNNDGKNDVFAPVASAIQGYSMVIFNRWGEQVFNSTKDYDVWNGTLKNTQNLAKQDEYIYKIIIKDAKGKDHNFMGSVNLIR